ncbi:MAG: hypothetical protein QM723_05175 [Myxococcaceae bacterium]
MELPWFFALFFGFWVVVSAIRFFDGRRRTRAWFDAVSALGLTPGGNYPSLTASGKWAGGVVDVRHFEIGSGKSSVTWHHLSFSRPGLTGEPIGDALAPRGFVRDDEPDTLAHKEYGALDPDSLRALLEALRLGN